MIHLWLCHSRIVDRHNVTIALPCPSSLCAFACLLSIIRSSILSVSTRSCSDSVDFNCCFPWRTPPLSVMTLWCESDLLQSGGMALAHDLPEGPSTWTPCFSCRRSAVVSRLCLPTSSLSLFRRTHAVTEAQSNMDLVTQQELRWRLAVSSGTVHQGWVSAAVCRFV